jgi:hypothetical protein
LEAAIDLDPCHLKESCAVTHKRRAFRSIVAAQRSPRGALSLPLKISAHARRPRVDASPTADPTQDLSMRTAKKLCRVLAGSALASLCLTLDAALADPAGSSPAENRTGSAVVAALSDLIFDATFDGQTNGGTSCATANELTGETTFSADTTTTTNWMSSFGPLISQSNDVVYTFVAGPDVEGSITPTISNYAFAMYLIEACAESGTEPQPIGATATPGAGIDLAAAGVVSGHTYYLAITGVAGGGPGANGTLNFTTPSSFAVRP